MPCIATVRLRFSFNSCAVSTSICFGRDWSRRESAKQSQPTFLPPSHVAANMAISAMRPGNGRCVRASMPSVSGCTVRRRAFAGIGCSRLPMPTLGGSARTKGLGAGLGCSSTGIPCRKTGAGEPQLLMSLRGDGHPGGVHWPRSQRSPEPRLRIRENAAFLDDTFGRHPSHGGLGESSHVPSVANQIGVLPLWQIVLAHAAQIIICFQLAKLLARVAEAASDRVEEVLIPTLP